MTRLRLWETVCRHGLLAAGLTWNGGAVTLHSDGSFSYMPSAGFVGADSFDYNVTENGVTSVATASITVTDNAPVATNYYNSVMHDKTLSVTNAAYGLLQNAWDPDGDSLQAIEISGPTHGSVVLNSDGTFSYTPNVGYAGSDSFMYEVSDGAMTSNMATATITMVNSAPVANSYNRTKSSTTQRSPYPG